jgi:hypothetical protein
LQAVLVDAVNDESRFWGDHRGLLAISYQFDWSGPLLVDGQAEPIAGFKHVENPYALAEFPAESMEIGYGEDMLRLHLA